MRSLILTVAAISLASPAMAQSGWTSNNYGGPTRYYNGTGDNSGWSGSSNNYGGPTTYSNFNGPNGQTYNCTSNNYGGPITYTNCQ